MYKNNVRNLNKCFCWLLPKYEGISSDSRIEDMEDGITGQSLKWLMLGEFRCQGFHRLAYTVFLSPSFFRERKTIRKAMLKTSTSNSRTYTIHFRETRMLSHNNLFLYHLCLCIQPCWPYFCPAMTFVFLFGPDSGQIVNRIIKQRPFYQPWTKTCKETLKFRFHPEIEVEPIHSYHISIHIILYYNAVEYRSCKENPFNFGHKVRTGAVSHFNCHFNDN